MHILHKMNAHWRHDSLLHWRTWIEDKLNAFSKNNCVSEFTSQLFLYFLSCLHKNKKCSPPLSLRPFQVNEKEHFCVKYLNVLKINCFFFITEYNNDKNLFRKNISNHNEKKNRSHSVCLWQIEPKSTPTTWKPINPIHLQPHQNQLFTLMKSQNQNTGDL